MRRINRLNARAVQTITEVGRHADGGNLYLSISPNGGRRWTFLYRWHGKPTEIGFGSARDVPLARARELAKAARAKLAEGIQPSSPKRSASGVTFGDMVDTTLDARRGSWRSERHAAQWENTLREYAAPLLRLPVTAVTTEDVLGVLRPIWATKNATAIRLRGRIELVLDHAKAKGMRSGENPARWRGHLDQLLHGRQRLAKQHLAAMPYRDVPAFVTQLRNEDSVEARALEFVILTVARSGEVFGARRCEFDFAAKLWMIPAERMKGGHEHIVPLCDRAVELAAAATSDLVFAKRGKPIGTLTRLPLVKAAGVTVHGFRSSFRDWAGDCTHVAREVIEFALAHGITDATEAAYRRSTALEKRRELIKMWFDYLNNLNSPNVVSFGRKVPG